MLRLKKSAEKKQNGEPESFQKVGISRKRMFCNFSRFCREFFIFIKLTFLIEFAVVLNV